MDAKLLWIIEAIASLFEGRRQGERRPLDLLGYVLASLLISALFYAGMDWLLDTF